MSRITHKNDVSTETTPLLDPRDDEAENGEGSKTGHLWVIPALAIGCFLGAADQTIVISSYGQIGSELNALSKTSWLATAYLLPLSSFQILYGKLSDIFGRRALLVFAYATFGLGCLLCGLAQTMDQLIIARAISGMGGGGFNTLATIVLSDLVPLRQRGKWQGYRDLVFALGLGVGSLGGLITETIGWRWSFLLQLPLVLIGLVNIFLVFKNDYCAKEDGWRRKIRRIDFGGAFLVIAAVSSLLVGVEQASRGSWNSPFTVGCLCTSVVLFAAFFYVELNVAAEPFAPKHMLFARTVGSCFAVSFFAYGCWLSILYQLPLYWQAVGGGSPSATAVRLLPGFVSGVFGSLFAGYAMQITGRYYWLTVVSYGGMTLSVIPVVLCTGWAIQSTLGVMLGLGFCGFFLNNGAITSLVAMMANSAPEDLATAISTLHLFRSLGSSICLALSTATVQRVLRSQLYQQFDGRDAELVDDAIQSITESLGNISDLIPGMQVVVRGCYEVAVRWSLVVCFCFAAMAFLSSLAIRERSLVTSR